MARMNMRNSEQQNLALKGVLAGIAFLLVIASAWIVVPTYWRRESEHAPESQPAAPAPSAKDAQADFASPPMAVGQSPSQPQLEHDILSGSSPEDAVLDLIEFQLAAQRVGVKLTPLEEAKHVAQRFAIRRWKGCRIGPAQLACAPDGLPEVYFCLVFKQGIAQMSPEALAERIAALRRERIKLESQLANASPDERSRIACEIKALWRQMRGADKYATIVVGANDGREPFIASFNGLAPQVFLREDAIAARREPLGGKEPVEPRIIWFPPLFVAFEFPPPNGRGASIYLEARGVKLQEMPLPEWKRPRLPDHVLQQRRGKWRSLKEAPHG